MIRRLSEHERKSPALCSLALTAPEPATTERADASSTELSSALERLLADERALSPTRIRALLEQALVRFCGDRGVTLQVHPEDLCLLDDAAELSARLELRSPLSVCADPRIARGGFVLASPRGEIDARVETQLERALAQLLRGKS